MDQQLYDIHFSGQLVDGVSPESAQTKLAALFNSSPDNIARIFNGKTQALKRAVNQADALKYKAAFHQAGLVVSFKSHQPTTAQLTSRPRQKPEGQPQPSKEIPSTGPKRAEKSQIRQNQASVSDWSVAPAGSDILQQHERTLPPARPIDTSGIKMVSVFFEPEVDAAKPADAPDTRHISMAAVGEDLLTEKYQAPPPLALDIDDITLAPAGTNLEELPDTRTPLNPDTAYLSIAEAGVNLLEIKEEAVSSPAPAIDHLSIARD